MDVTGSTFAIPLMFFCRKQKLNLNDIKIKETPFEISSGI
jgi:hypothetical protein